MGGKQADGREVDGLGEEVQNLGAEAVLATLWPVADESTAELMAEFYRLKEQGLTKAEALRRAQLSLLRGTSGAQNTGSVRGVLVPKGATVSPQKAGYSHPFYWAPFILIGNWK
jgi:CHAT domain-containing protein